MGRQHQQNGEKNAPLDASVTNVTGEKNKQETESKALTHVGQKLPSGNLGQKDEKHVLTTSKMELTVCMSSMQYDILLFGEQGHINELYYKIIANPPRMSLLIDFKLMTSVAREITAEDRAPLGGVFFEIKARGVQAENKAREGSGPSGFEIFFKTPQAQIEKVDQQARIEEVFPTAHFNQAQ